MEGEEVPNNRMKITALKSMLIGYIKQHVDMMSGSPGWKKHERIRKEVMNYAVLKETG